MSNKKINDRFLTFENTSYFIHVKTIATIKYQDIFNSYFKINNLYENIMWKVFVSEIHVVIF